MTKLVSGSANKLPDIRKRNRSDYEWDKLNIGDHYEFTNTEDFGNIRSSAAQFSHGSKKRAERDFRTRVVERTEKDKDGNEVSHKVLEVWRFPDPTPAETAASKTE